MLHYSIGCALLIAAASASAQQAVSFKSPNDSFRVNSTATATVTKTGPFLKVAIDQHVMWQPKKYSEASEVTGYTVGIGGNNADGRWEIERSSATVPVSLQLQAGSTKQLAPATVLIPMDGMPSLDGKWLIMTMHLAEHGGKATTYAHSEKLTIK